MKAARAAVAAGVLAALAAPALARDVAYVTSQGDGVAVVDAADLTVARTVDLGDSGPRGLALTPDGKYLLTANQKTADLAVIDTASLKVVRRVPIGKNPEFLRILPGGGKAFVTYEPGSKGGPPGKGGDDDDEGPKIPAEVAVIDLSTWKVVHSIVGAPETEGIEFSADQKTLAITNEGDDTVTVYDVGSYKLLKTVDLHGHGHRPRGIKLSPDGAHYVVTMEDSNNFVVLDRDFNFVKSVPTATGPYGVAFDKAGKRIVVAAARAARLQVFDAASYEPLADVAVGKRCWHFTFTPDESRLVLACGRSNDLEVVDATSYKLTKTVPGFKLPWGIVTYPKAYGSLETTVAR
jgi:YVTN family beta-propeller protein